MKGGYDRDAPGLRVRQAQAMEMVRDRRPPLPATRARSDARQAAPVPSASRPTTCTPEHGSGRPLRECDAAAAQAPGAAHNPDQRRPGTRPRRSRLRQPGAPDVGEELRKSAEAAQPGRWGSRLGLVGSALRLAARLVHRLAGRVALRAAVVRTLAAIARSEVRVGKGGRRRDREGGDCEDRCIPPTSQFARSGANTRKLRTFGRDSYRLRHRLFALTQPKPARAAPVRVFGCWATGRCSRSIALQVSSNACS